ncbi:MAG TPA: TonB family protein [Opitutaceae bacterium]|nr:TonB family protein [Opitutaceae bacterium]
MSTSQEKGYFLELNEYFLLAARTSSLAGPPVIEDLREAPLDSKAAVSHALNSAFPETKKAAARAVCALRPRQRFFHLAGDSETRQYSDPTALRAFINHSPQAASAANELVALQTSSGVPLNGSGKVEGRWIFEGSPHDSLASMQATVRGWKLVPFRLEAATLALLGAIHAEQQVNKASGPLLLWEIGETSSDLFLVSAKGLMAAKRLALGFSQIADAVQSELNLKSKESAAKVFFNEFYDFSELGAKITARISTALLPEITEFLPAGIRASVTLLCAGLPSKQAWFNEHLARSLGLASWQPDLVGWCGRAGLNFIGNTLQASLSPVWLGLLGVMSAFQSDKPEADAAWHPVWSCNGKAPIVEDKPAVAAAPPKPEPAPTSPALETVKAALSPATPPAEKAVLAAASTPPPAPATPVAPAPATATGAPAAPAKEAAPATRATVAASVPPPPSPAAAPPVPATKAVAASTPPAPAPAKSVSTAATRPPEKPVEGDRAAHPAAASVAPLIATVSAAAPAPSAPPAASAKAKPVASVPPPPPSPSKTRAPAAATLADGLEKRDKPTAVHAPLAAPTPVPAVAATAVLQPSESSVAAAEAAKPIAPVAPSPAIAPAATPSAPATPAPEPAVEAAAKPAAASGRAGHLPEAPRAPAPAPASETAPFNSPSPAASAAPPAGPTLPRSGFSPPVRLTGKPVVEDVWIVRKRPFLRTPVGIAVIGSAVLILGATIFFYRQFAEEKAAALRAQAAAEQRAAAEAVARRQAEQQAKAEAEARRLAEAEAARKNTAAEAARQQAAEEARRHEIETNRLLNGRGSLVLASEPAGANVEISNLAPHVTPVTISDLRLGRYAIKLSLPGYDPANVEVEIKDNESTDPGTIHLIRQTGSLNLTTVPAGMKFEVRPAASRFFAAASDVRQGTTPVTLADLPTGEYTVIFSREGWPNHTQNVVVEHNAAAQAASAFAGGTVTISSAPPGASVSCNGVALGVTPLTLTDVQPGATTYSLELTGFVPIDVSGQVEPEKAIQLEGTLTPADRIARIADLDERPEPIKTVEPSVNQYQVREGGKVTIALTIDRDGVPKDLKVEQASNADLGRRCLEAVAQWRFKPGKIRGVPVKTRVSLPFNIAPP